MVEPEDYESKYWEVIDELRLCEDSCREKHDIIEAQKAEIERLKWDLDILRARAELTNGEFCVKSRADGRGPCGCCGWCVQQQKTRADSLEKELLGLMR